MSERADVYQRLKELTDEVIELFDWLVRTAKRRWEDHPSLGHVLPGLHAKGRSDFAALADLTWSDKTSGAAALARMFLEDTVDLCYLTSGDLEECERRARTFLCRALVEDERQVLVERHLEQTHKRGEPYSLDAPSFKKEALAATIARLRQAEDGTWAKDLLPVLEGWGTKVPPYPKMPERLKKTKAHPVVMNNLVGAYRRYYSGFSDFVHGGAALKHIVEVDQGGELLRVGLSKGRLPDHETPLITALLFAPDFLGRYDLYNECGAEERVRAVAEKRWSVLAEMFLESE